MQQNRKNTKGGEYFCKALYLPVCRPPINFHDSCHSPSTFSQQAIIKMGGATQY
jgi:hypothetical protein